jgi:hypothetical protein
MSCESRIKSECIIQMVADEHGLQLGGMMDGVGSVGNTINIERKLRIKMPEIERVSVFYLRVICDAIGLIRIHEGKILLLLTEA